MEDVFNFRWDCTCAACPEQYDIYLNGNIVAYFRLRWGYLYVSVYNDLGSRDEVIYEQEYGHPSCGSLDIEDEERIKKIVEQKILEYLIQKRSKNEHTGSI